VPDAAATTTFTGPGAEKEMGLKRKFRRNSRLARAAGEVKMSEVLVEIAAPLLRNLPDEDDLVAVEGALDLAAALWNARLIPGMTGHDRIIAEFKEALDEPPRPEFDSLLREVLGRADLFYRGLDRPISGVRVAPKPGGGYTVTVASYV
jgi:hypothetical protein